jgi:inner membrane protein
MASALSHAATALAIGACFDRTRVPREALLAGMALAVVPDLDAVGYWMGVPGRSLLGHRGLTHSLAFALVGGLAAAWLYARPGTRGGHRASLGLYFTLVLASHGFLDALTNGGAGIAFFSPFSNHRYFFPFRPIQVSPIGVGVFNARGVRILLSEIRWVLLPAAALATVGIVLRRVWPRPGSEAA